MNNNYDIAIVGLGAAGVFASLKISRSYRGLKVLCIEGGRPSRKRRVQCAGYLGLLPMSDGKLYLNDLSSVSSITSPIKTKKAYEWFKSQTEEVLNFSIIKDTSPSINAKKRINKAGFDLKLNNYIQLFPSEIHSLSKFISDQIEEKENITSIFDTDVIKIVKERGHFLVSTDTEQYKCKKILLAVGRSGWRWSHDLFKQLGLVIDNDYAEIGIRIELEENLMKEYNNSNCSIFNDDLNIGPLSWNGMVLPEDHFDMAISAFRSNEDRWNSKKVSFNLLSKIFVKNNGVEQMNRIGQLSFILTNDRIAKEKISTLLAKKSKLTIMPEYDWLGDAVRKINDFMPNIISKGYFHFPTLMPLTSKIKLNKSFGSELDGLYVAGESARIPGILGAITSGIIAGENICK